jgi:hypothetical protein
VDIKFSINPEEATMYRRKRRILKTLILGIAVAAFAAPAAFGEPRGAGNSPNHPDFWNYNATTGEKIANTSPEVAPADLAGMYSTSETSIGSDDRSLYRGTSPQLDPLIGDAIRAHQNQVSGSSDDRSFYRGATPQLDPTYVGSPDDRKVFRGVETPNVTLSPAIRGEQVKTFDRPSFAPASQPSVTGTADDGFQWVDAGLGAASTLALVLLMGAGALLIRQQRRRIAAY